MKLRSDVKRKLLKPKIFGALMVRLDTPYSTLERWIRTSYKDLRLPENMKVIEEVTGLTQEEIFEQEKVK